MFRASYVTVTRKLGSVSVKRWSFQVWGSHVKDKTITRPSYLEQVDLYTGRMISLYWDSPQIIWNRCNVPWPTPCKTGWGKDHTHLGYSLQIAFLRCLFFDAYFNFGTSWGFNILTEIGSSSIEFEAWISNYTHKSVWRTMWCNSLSMTPCQVNCISNSWSTSIYFKGLSSFF